MTIDPVQMDPRRIETLRAIMKALRTPVTGCPWDLEQNFETIAPYTIEEAYEVADAITRGNRADLCEELGDLLLQTVYHAQLADEEGAFTLDDVLETINKKMVRRHPHVFGSDAARSAKLAKGLWEDIKAKERAKDNYKIDDLLVKWYGYQPLKASGPQPPQPPRAPLPPLPFGSLPARQPAGVR